MLIVAFQRQGLLTIQPNSFFQKRRMEVTEELLPKPVSSGSVWHKRCSYRNALLRIPSRTGCKKYGWQSPTCHHSICSKVILPHSGSRPLTEHSEGTSAGPFLNTGLLWQATLLPGHPISLAQPFLEPHCSLRLLPPSPDTRLSPLCTASSSLSFTDSSCQYISCTSRPT